MRHPAKVYVVDTNALLNDPEVIHAFSGAEVVIPGVVLRELDDLKRRRTDRRVSYHGRKATRLLFEVSKNGRLLDGITLENGSTLRVDPTEEFDQLPPDLDLGRPDDLIIALAYSLNRQPGVHVTLVTNDLNMLLRGETLGLDAYRFEGKLEHLHPRRPTPVEWARERRLTLLFAILACLFFTTTLYLYATRPPFQPLADIAMVDEAFALRQLGMSAEAVEQHYRERLRKDRNEVSALVNLGNLLFRQGEELAAHEEDAASRGKFLEAAELYRRALEFRPDDADLRSDLGIALIRVDRPADAVPVFLEAIKAAPNHPLAHYNLGIAYIMLNDRDSAILALVDFLRLAEGSELELPVLQAQQIIEELRQTSASQ